MRRPAVADMFYPGSRNALRKTVENCFLEGPGPLEECDENDDRVLGLVSPHAGYTYSGKTAAYGFKELCKRDLPDTAVILGPNHHGWGPPVAMSGQDWEMPMGTIKCDLDLMERIDMPVDETAHAQEHSLEVQVPFLQYLKPDLKMVGISMLDQSLDTSRRIGSTIARAAGEIDRKVVVIASSDMTHCGRNYGLSVPGGMNSGQYARSIDMPVIEKLLNWDLEGAFKTRNDLGVTACGMGPIAAMMTAAREMGGENCTMQSYTTSHDVIESHSAVGYVSLVIR